MAAKFMLLFLCILLLPPGLILVSGDIYYIIPMQDDPCYTEDPCLTLLEFTANISNYIETNTTLFITGGTHYLDTNLSVSNAVEFSMFSAEDNSNQSEIYCTEHSGFTFSQVDRVYISGLSFIGCGGNRFESVDQLVIENAKFMGQTLSMTPLVISESSINLTTTTFLSNVAGSIHSAFSFDRYLQITLESSMTLTGASVGGALILTHSTLNVDKCLFEDNSANVGGAIFSELDSNITITNSVFTSNDATGCNSRQCFGGVFFIDGSGSVTINNSTFQNNTSDGDGGVGVVFNASLTLSHSNMFNNSANRYHGGALACYGCERISINATTFDNNRANSDGGSMYLYQSSVAVLDSNFFSNEGNRIGGAIALTNSSSAAISSSMHLRLQLSSCQRRGTELYVQLNCLHRE